MQRNSLRKSSGPATSHSMLTMRVKVCGVFASLRNARGNFSRIMNVNSTLPLIEPMTVSASVGTTPGFALSHSRRSACVRPMRHFALVFVSGLLCGLRRVPAKGRSCFFAAKSPLSIHPYIVLLAYLPNSSGLPAMTASTDWPCRAAGVRTSLILRTVASSGWTPLRLLTSTPL